MKSVVKRSDFVYISDCSIAINGVSTLPGLTSRKGLAEILLAEGMVFPFESVGEPIAPQTLRKNADKKSLARV
jgi:hypothetical protein